MVGQRTLNPLILVRIQVSEFCVRVYKKSMTNFHPQLLNQIIANKRQVDQEFLAKYLGNPHSKYRLRLGKR